MSSRRTLSSHARLLLASTFLLGAAAFADEPVAAPPGDLEARRWRGPDGPLPFTAEEEIEDFLSSAPIVSREELTGGVNRPLKVRLEKGGVAANAIFRVVDVRHRRARLDGKILVDFHDSYVYECAAYQVSRLLGLDHVPPCVRRRYALTSGTLQLWIEEAMTEKARRDAGRQPPRLMVWRRQKQTMRLFDALIYNFDRNQGNMLIDSDWKLWFIDHTRSFRKSPVIEKLEGIYWCQRGVWERLQALDKKQLRRLKPYLSSAQIHLLLERRDKLVEHLQAKIDAGGEGSVLFDAYDAGAAFPADAIEDDEDDIPVASSKLEDPGGL